MARKTIAGLELELSMVRDSLTESERKRTALEQQLLNARQWANRHVEITDRLLNIMENKAKEGIA